MTDTMGFFIGLELFYAYIQDRRWRLVLVTVLGSFAWQTTQYYGAALLALPAWASAPRRRVVLPITGAAFASMAVVAITVLLSVMRFRNSFVKLEAELPKRFTTGSWWDCYPASLLLLLVYVGITAYVLSRVALGYTREQWLGTLRRGAVLAFIAVAPVFLYQQVLIGYLLIPQDFAVGARYKSLATAMIFTCLMKPGLSIVAHLAHFGPVALLALLVGRRVARMAADLGMGLLLCLGLLAVQGIGSESRWLIVGFPMLAVLTTLVVDERRCRANTLASLILISLVLSKMWLPLNLVNRYDLSCYLFVVSWGPWMDSPSYVIHGLVTVAVAVYLMQTEFFSEAGHRGESPMEPVRLRS
jgi:hypothetical protein